VAGMNYPARPGDASKSMRGAANGLTALASVEPGQTLGAYRALSVAGGGGMAQSSRSDESPLAFDGTVQSSMPSATLGLLDDPAAGEYGWTVIRNGPLAIHHGTGLPGWNRGSFGIGAPACAGHEKGPRQGALAARACARRYRPKFRRVLLPAFKIRAAEREKARRGFPPGRNSSV
jgi:hypothetical protein